MLIIWADGLLSTSSGHRKSFHTLTAAKIEMAPMMGREIGSTTDHSVRNVGGSELVYVVVETYPDGYLPNEPTWDSHIEALTKHYGLESKA